MPTTLTLQPTGQVLTVPTQWRDVTLAQYVALFAPDPTANRRPAEILLSLDAGALDQLAADDVKYLATLLAFAADPADVLALLPTPNLPNIGSLPYGILLEAQNHLEANPDQPGLAYAPYLLALYRVQLAYGKYSAGKVAACLAAVLAAPVTEVLADATFFLSSYKRWASATPPTPTTAASPTRTKQRPGLSGWLRGLGLFSGWTWPPVGPSSTTRGS